MLGAPEDQDPPGRGCTAAVGIAPLGESGCNPLMVLGADKRVKWARQKVLRGRLETKGAGLVSGGDREKAKASGSPVVAP